MATKYKPIPPKMTAQKTKQAGLSKVVGAKGITKKKNK